VLDYLGRQKIQKSLVLVRKLASELHRALVGLTEEQRNRLAAFLDEGEETRPVDQDEDARLLSKGFGGRGTRVVHSDGQLRYITLRDYQDMVGDLANIAGEATQKVLRSRKGTPGRPAGPQHPHLQHFIHRLRHVIEVDCEATKGLAYDEPVHSGTLVSVLEALRPCLPGLVPDPLPWGALNDMMKRYNEARRAKMNNV
jgi:hypothetical protein